MSGLRWESCESGLTHHALLMSLRQLPVRAWQQLIGRWAGQGGLSKHCWRSQKHDDTSTTGR
eukprot:8722243-Alexandrium_andersonii.AAC.1